MHRYIYSIGGCFGRDCNVDSLPDRPTYEMWVHNACPTRPQSSSPVESLTNLLSLEYLGSGAHRKRPSFFTSCTSTSLMQRAS
jgi:hypothetical protein